VVPLLVLWVRFCELAGENIFAGAACPGIPVVGAAARTSHRLAHSDRSEKSINPE
jgi:hypothetical protein